MRNVVFTILIACITVCISTSCAMQQKKVLKEVNEAGPVDCTTAQGDLRLLHHEKANVAERMEEGITAIFPAGLVLGVLTGVEGTKVKVAIGTYNKAIDKRIAEIRAACDLE